MTSANKHRERSRRSHVHFTTSRNYSDRPSKHGVSTNDIAAAIARNPRWFWNVVDYIAHAVSGMRNYYGRRI